MHIFMGVLAPHDRGFSPHLLLDCMVALEDCGRVRYARLSSQLSLYNILAIRRQRLHELIMI